MLSEIWWKCVPHAVGASGALRLAVAITRAMQKSEGRWREPMIESIVNQGHNGGAPRSGRPGVSMVA